MVSGPSGRAGGDPRDSPAKRTSAYRLIDLENKRPEGEVRPWKRKRERDLLPARRKLITPLGLPDLTRLEVGGGKGLTHLDLWLDLPETQLREAQPPRREPPGPG